MKDKGKVLIAICVFVAINCSTLVLDYFDLPSMLGISIANCNWDFQSIIIGNGIVVLLFVLAFVLLDKRSIEKEKNKRHIALVVLRDTYKECQKLIERFSDEKVRRNLAKGYNIDELGFQDPTRTYYRNYPFAENNETIMLFAQEGILSGAEIDVYLEIKKRFFAFIEVAFILSQNKESTYVVDNGQKLMKKLNEILLLVEKELSDAYHRKTLRRRH